MKKLENITPYRLIKDYKLGQAGEVSACYTLTGEVKKPDANTPFYIAGDFSCAEYGEVQVKTQKATVCEGWSIEAHIAKDKANTYAYVTKSLEWVILMSPAEWKVFLERFAYTCYSSDGTRQKMRLKAESTEMLMWLDEKINGRVYGRPAYYTRG